ncbi:MAG: S4 domain-containing protein [Acidobacteriota bacterium]|nr:S4 domain-containing protein [Acidobacteriota bacterium]
MLQRLQKIIARAGIASRRHAEQLILSGQVRVNGAVVTELGSKADPDQDRIEAAGKIVEANERRVYIALNKPPEVVSTLADPEGRKTLRNCLKGLPERVYPVGRLDYNASGLVFLTNDGDLAAEMLKDWPNLQQIYHVKIKGRLMMEELERLGRNAAATIRTVRQPDATRGHATNFWYEVTLEDSTKDILRRVLFAENHPVEKLKRIGLGPLNLEGLPQGRYRLLVEKEVADLRRALKIKPKPRFYPPAKKESEEQAAVPAIAPRPFTPRPGPGNFRKANYFREPGKVRNFNNRPSSNNVRSANKTRVLEDDGAAAPARPQKFANNRGKFNRPDKFNNSSQPSGAPTFKGPNKFRTSDQTARPNKFGRPTKFSGPNRFSGPNKFSRTDDRAGSNDFRSPRPPASQDRPGSANKFGRPTKFSGPNKFTGPNKFSRTDDRAGSSDFRAPRPPVGQDRLGSDNKSGRPNKFNRPNRPNSNRPGSPNPSGAPRKPFRPHRDNRS